MTKRKTPASKKKAPKRKTAKKKPEPSPSSGPSEVYWNIQEHNLPPSPPVRVALPSISTEKWKAIRDLSEAVKELSIALNGTHTKVDVSNNTILATGAGPAISITQDS